MVESEGAVQEGGSRPSTWRDLFGAVVVFSLSCGVFLVSAGLIRRPPAWLTFEFCQYAEIGRNLRRDGAFETNLVEPMALAYLDRHQGGTTRARWPVINRYPLPCVVVAGLMRVLGPSDMAAAWSNGPAIGLLAALTYALACRWYGRGRGALAALLFLTNPSFYGSFVLLGTPDIWFAVLFDLELLAFAWTLESRAFHAGRSAGPGVLAGLAYLARFNAALFLAIEAGALLARRRWREAAIMAVAGLAVAAPLLVYNVRHFQRPTVSIYSAWNLLDEIGAYRVEPWLYYQLPDVASLLRAHESGLLRKFATNLSQIAPIRIWSLWHWVVLSPMVLVGPAIVRPGPVARRFLLWAAGLFALQVVVFSALRLELEDRLSPHHGRYFFWFAAPALLLGVGALRRLSGRSAWRRVPVALLIAAQFGVYGQTWWGWVAERHLKTNLGDDPIRQALAEIIPGDRVVASNQPQVLTWRSGLKAVSMPADPEELDRLNRDSPTPVDFVFLDLNFNCIELDRPWRRVVAPTADPGPSWEGHLLRRYEYVLPPERTRPLQYVLLRRRGLPASQFERRLGLVGDRRQRTPTAP